MICPPKSIDSKKPINDSDKKSKPIALSKEESEFETIRDVVAEGNPFFEYGRLATASQKRPNHVNANQNSD